MAAPRPLPATPPGLLDDEDPGKWEKLKQVLWESNLNAPVRGVYNLMNTPYDVLMGGQSPEFDQAVADSFDAAGGVTVGSAMIPKPSNALMAGYGKVPDTLMGFRSKGPNKGFNEGNFPYAADVVVDFGDGVPHHDAIRGMNKDHILERARRNWPDAKGIQLSGDPYQYQAPSIDASPPRGIRAFHGSPHSFDKFSMDKIGTGVGAPSAFSKGLYFSGAEKNAEHFKALGASPMIGGKKGRAAGLSDDAYESVWRFAHDEGKSGTLADVAAAAEADLLARSKELPFSARRDYQRVIDELNARGGEDVQLGANMYEVDINADPSTFADWDAPISQQSETVKNALADFPPEKTWGQIYDTGKIGEAEMLKRGVSGTKFKANDGTSNYVVFDDKLIDIIKKYGIAGLLGAGGMYGMSADEAQAGAR